MAFLHQAKTEQEIRSLGVKAVRDAYNILATDYNHIVDNDWYYCHGCNQFLQGSEMFYSDKRYASGVYPICKRCLIKQATDYDKKTNQYIDNREKTIEVFRQMDIPFIDSLYKQALNSAAESINEKNRQTAYQQLLVMVKSLPQYKGKTFKESEFDDDGEPLDSELSKRKPRKEIIKTFGSGFTNEEYLYLQDQYDDWRSRTQVDSKSQETYIIRICHKLLDIWKAERAGQDTTKMDDSLNKLMEAAKLQPKQNVSNAATDSLTFGQLIEKWETEKPIPEPSPEFKDVDGIGKYIRVWFTGWLSKALGLNANVFTKEFDEEIAKYTVSKHDNEDEGSSDEIYEQIFGTDGNV